MQLAEYSRLPMEKNRIIFLNGGKQYYVNLNGDQRLDVFHRGMMDVFLEQYEQLLNLIVTYDDIISICTNENTDEMLVDLPNNLKELRMISSMCTMLVLPKTLEYIDINTSNLTELPDMSHCTKLTHCVINISNIEKCAHTIPPSVKILNLQNNRLKTMDKTYFTNHIVPDTNMFIKSFHLNVNGNYFDRDQQAAVFQENCQFLRQKTLLIKPNIDSRPIPIVNNDNVANEHIRNFLETGARARRPAAVQAIGPVIARPAAVAPTANVLENNTQTVHLSSINNSVVKSIEALRRVVEKRELLMWDLSTKHHVHTILNKYNKPNFMRRFIQKYICITYNANVSFVFSEFQNKTVHTLLHCTYKQLFELIVTVIMSPVFNNETRELLLMRLNMEIKDSIGYCFTGKMNRLVNAVSGTLEGVSVKISGKEEIQIHMQKLVKKIGEQDVITPAYFSQIMKETRDMFRDIHENDPSITDAYAQAWIDGLLDFEPEPEPELNEKEEEKMPLIAKAN